MGFLADERPDVGVPALDAVLRADLDAPACLALRDPLAVQEGRPAEALGLLKSARPAAGAWGFHDPGRPP